jgi:hypothetical protein
MASLREIIAALASPEALASPLKGEAFFLFARFSAMLSPSARALESAPLLCLLAMSRGLELSFSAGSYVVSERSCLSSASFAFSALSELEAFLLWLPEASAELLLPSLSC